MAADFFRIAEAKRIWNILEGKLAKLTIGDQETTNMLIGLNIIWHKAYSDGNVSRLEWVIAKGDELKELIEAPQRAQEEAKRRGRELKAAKRARELSRRQVKVAGQQAALDNALKNLKPGQAPAGVETKGLAEAEREYREREHIVAHGKKKARPTKKGKSKGK